MAKLIHADVRIHRTYLRFTASEVFTDAQITRRQLLYWHERLGYKNTTRHSYRYGLTEYYQIRAIADLKRAGFTIEYAIDIVSKEVK